jgi:glycosyltransferase involved in cell wall biosynthesis
MSSSGRPVRVLHLIDGLGGGGSERSAWDIVRLSDPHKVSYRVATIFSDDGSYVYADRLRQAGVYRFPHVETKETLPNGVETLDARTIRSRIPSSLKRPLRPFWHLVRAFRNPVLPQFQKYPDLERDALIKSDPSELLQWPADKILRYFQLWSQSAMSEAVWATGWQRVLDECLDFQPDIIHGHLSHSFAFGLSLKLLFNVPFVYTVPALFSQLEDENVDWLPKLYELFHPWLDRLLTAYPSELLDIGVPAKKLITLDGVVDLQGVASIRSAREAHRLEIRRALGIAEDTLIALSVGRLHPTKGHHYALAALPSLVTKLPNLHWVVLGANWMQEREKLEALARELGVREHSHIVGFVPNPLPFYAAADIYLRTAVLEGDNLSSYQAMAIGLPVVGFATGRRTELIEKVGHGILVPPRDAEAIAAAVQRIFLLPDRGRALGEHGVDYCRAHLDLQQSVNMVVSMYTEIHQNGTVATTLRQPWSNPQESDP